MTSHPSPEDRAWAAGFFEGDGTCTYMNKRRPVLRVAQVERERLERLQSILGGFITGPHRNNKTFKNSKPLWQWTQQRECDEAVELMWPYLGPTTRKKIREVYKTVDKRDEDMYRMRMNAHRKRREVRKNG